MNTLWAEAAPWAHLIMMFCDKAINGPAPTGEALIAAGFLGRYVLSSLCLPGLEGLFVTMRASQGLSPRECETSKIS